ncbi:MAG TPA: small basic protein [Planctomycetota bacterium]|nr:small basic protein [Planctomycetota bacterium]
MSIHKSLATKGSLVRARNVLSRFERILQLRKTGKWNDATSSAFGLQKVRVLKVKKRVKEKKKEEAVVPGAATPAGAAAAPVAAAGKTPAAGKGPAGKAAAPSKK